MKKNTKKTSNNIKTRQTKLSVKTNKVKKRLVKKTRPFHKKVALHPLNVMFMLCLGVLLIMTSINAAADSYTVTATVPLPPGPSSPAVITSPTDGSSTSSNNITVSGTCPIDTYTSEYVAMITNDVVNGYANCSGGTFSINTSLVNGNNTLQVRIYDSYNTSGPMLPPINVNYIAPTPPPIQPVSPIIAPTNSVPSPQTTTPYVEPQSVNILQVDNNVPYVSQSLIPDVSIEPTLTGTAPPLSHVIVTIHSNPILCETYANSQGYWTCKIDQELPLGLHHVYVQATTTLGNVLTFQTFQIMATSKPTLVIPAETKFSLTTNFKPIQYLINQDIVFNLNPQGGVSPYAYIISWGDGTTTEVTRISGGPFSIDHSYDKTSSLITYQKIKVYGIDSQGNSTSLQLFAQIKNPAYTNVVAYVSQSTGLWAVLAGIKPWLVIIWPAYVVVLLMALSFWLGEKEMIIRLLNSRDIKTKTAHRHR